MASKGSQKLQTQVTLSSHLPFTGCLLSLCKEKKANSMEKSKPKDTQSKTFSHYLTKSEEITCRIKVGKLQKTCLKFPVSLFLHNNLQIAEDTGNLPS